MLYLLLQQLREWFDAGWLYAFPFGLLDQTQFRALAAALLAFLTVVLLGPPVIGWLRRQKIGDTGATDSAALSRHAASKANVPTMGGLLICGAIFVVTLLLADVGTFYVQVALLVVVWLTTLGGIDDWLKLTASRRGTGRQGLVSWEKLVFQLGLGLLVGWSLYRSGAAPTDGLLPEGPPPLEHVLNLPLQRTFEPGGGGLAEGLIYLSMPVFVLTAVLLIAGMSNAVNITDGMDGLAGGTSAIVSFGIMLLALIAGSEGMAQFLLVPHVPLAAELAVVAGAMAGACIGFLWWNWLPAQVFMGDTGSLTLGGLIAYIAIALRQEIVVLMMCGVFLLEIASVVIQIGWFKATRISTGEGRRVFRCAPYHHHLHLGGWAESQVVGRLLIVTVLLTVVAIATLKIR